MLKMIMPVFGSRLRICAAASIPFSIGIAMSMTTMSGLNSAARRTASRPSAASPMTDTSSDFSSRARSPWRTIPWSSAMSTRKLILLLQNWNLNAKASSGPWLGPYFKNSVQFSHPLFHAPQAEARLGPPAVKARAVIFDDRNHVVLGAVNRDANGAGVGVAACVSKRFLYDPVDARADLVGKRIHISEDRKLNRHVVSVSKLFGLPSQRRGQSQIVKHRRPQ